MYLTINVDFFAEKPFGIIWKKYFGEKILWMRFKKTKTNFFTEKSRNRCYSKQFDFYYLIFSTPAILYGM